MLVTVCEIREVILSCSRCPWRDLLCFHTFANRGKGATTCRPKKKKSRVGFGFKMEKPPLRGLAAAGPWPKARIGNV